MTGDVEPKRRPPAVWVLGASVLAAALLALLSLPYFRGGQRQGGGSTEEVAGLPPAFASIALLRPAEATVERLASLEQDGFTAVALLVEPGFDAADPAPASLPSGSEPPAIHVRLDEELRRAPERVRAAGLGLAWWVEVARQPSLADRLPAFMASLQGHPGWQRRFDVVPEPAAGEVVKCWPWLPLLTEEGLALHQAWVSELVPLLPRADGWYLDGLQGGPSACGCGNLQCRWTSDYGPARSTRPASDDAAARFVATIREALARAAGGAAHSPVVIPVWTTECEEADCVSEGKCAGVSCYEGACWRTLWHQLDPVAAASPTLGLLLLTKSFERSGADDRAGAAWIGPAIAALAADDPRRSGPPIAPSSLVAILEGAGRAPDVIASEVAAARAAGIRHVVVACTRLDQGFEPRVVAVRGSR